MHFYKYYAGDTNKEVEGKVQANGNEEEKESDDEPASNYGDGDPNGNCLSLPSLY